MNVVTPFEGIGASVRRKEDLRFLSGRGQYTDDINRPNQTYAYILRSPHAHARITGIDFAAAKAMPGVVAIFTGADMPDLGGIPCGWQIHNKDGSPMAEPMHPVLAVGKVRFVGDAVAVVIAETQDPGQGRRRGDQRRLRRAAGRRRRWRRRSPPARRPVHDEVAGNICYDWHIGDPAVNAAAFATARQGRRVRPGEQPAGAERDGAARGDRRFRPHHGRVHALHHQPEPACHPAADGRLRAASAGAQAARRGARCRRRLRHQDLPLRRGSDRHLGRRQGLPPGEVDGRAHRDPS